MVVLAYVLDHVFLETYLSHPYWGWTYLVFTMVDIREKLKETLIEIEELELSHELLGARFSVLEGARIDTYGGAVFVLESTKKTIDLLSRIDTLPIPKNPEPSN